MGPRNSVSKIFAFCTFCAFRDQDRMNLCRMFPVDPRLSATERSRLVGAHFSGGPIGTFIISQLAGFIGHQYGWEPIFRVSGILNVVFVLGWIFLVYDAPETHPYITNKERDYISKYQLHNCGFISSATPILTRDLVETRSKPKSTSKVESVPYRKILTSGDPFTFNNLAVKYRCGMGNDRKSFGRQLGILHNYCHVTKVHG